MIGALGLGCMGMSGVYGPGDCDDDESRRVIRRALDLGITLLDTADSYGPFHNEELVGSAIAGRRDDAVLATKCGFVIQGDGSVRRNARPDHIRAAAEASLRRLRVDTIDLFQLHRVDPTVPLLESWGAMADLVHDGKVRAIGLCEVSIDELEEAHSAFPVTSLESEFSVWTRHARADVLPWCTERGVTFLAFAPLGRGFLTGKLASADLHPRDWRSHNPRFTPDAMAGNQQIVKRLRAVGQRRGATPAQVALTWLLAQGPTVIPIPGTKKLRYLEENAEATSFSLSEADLLELEKLPEPVGARYSGAEYR